MEENNKVKGLNFYKKAFYSLLILVIVGLISFGAIFAESKQVKKYDVKNEKTAGRIVYGSYYDSNTGKRHPKVYTVYFRDGNKFDFYELNYANFEDNTIITPSTPRKLAFTIEVEGAVTDGDVVEHLRGVNYYAYGILLKGKITNAQNHQQYAVSIARYEDIQHVAINIHEDNDINNFGEDAKVSTLSLSIEMDESTSKNQYSQKRLDSMTRIMEGAFGK